MDFNKIASNILNMSAFIIQASGIKYNSVPEKQNSVFNFYENCALKHHLLYKMFSLFFFL